MRHEVFTAVKIRIVVFWVMMSHSLVGGYQCFGGTYHFHLQGGEGGSIETSLSLLKIGQDKTDY
jgi:hypothetical protein